MASGSHGWNGNCADLVMAAIGTSRATSLVTSGRLVHTGEPVATLTYGVAVPAMRTPVATSRLSPPLKVKNIVRRAGARAGELDRAMRKNDASEVSSQHTNSTSRSLLSTRATMEKVKITISQ